MKLLLVAHGYPPELVGGTEVSVQALARGLAERGHEVVVVAGSMQHEQGFRLSEAVDGPVRVRRIHRADLYFDHWQKSGSARVAEAFRDVLREERPDLVHVHHWIRLTRDLVFVAASEGVPAVVTLHDLWTTCLVAFRVRPDTEVFCDATLAPHPCLACAEGVPPRTPWVSPENRMMAFAERRADLLRELTLARAVVAPTRAHADAVARFLSVEEGSLSLAVVPHGRDLALAPRTPLAPPAEHGHLVLGAWGHLHPLKGQDLLLDALGRLEDPAAVELHLAGGEPDEAFARRLRERVARDPRLRVTFHGAYAVEDLATHPVTAVHAMASGTRAHESWGLVVDEAVALGLPLLLPATGAFPERLEEGRGALLYQGNDAGSLAASIARLAAEPGLVERLRASLPPLDHVAPSTRTHVDRILEVYDAARSAGPPERPQVDWWRARLALAAEEAWDESLGRRTPEELGF